MKVEKLEIKIKVPEEIEIKLDSGLLGDKGPKGESDRNFKDPRIEISLKEGMVILRAEKATKREAKMLRTFEAHIKNMFKGAKEGHLYKLKICSSHFPMTVKADGKEFSVKNFLGEKIPRTVKLRENVKVKVEGEIVTIESADKESAGQTASDIEELTKRSGFDRRIFQDGIWLISKNGKEFK